MNYLILTEKPSVAKDFAEYLGAKRKEGYYEVENSDKLKGNVRITWAYGHLFQIENTTQLPKKWVFENLPHFPAKFTYTTTKNTYSQTKIIRNLFKQKDLIVINAGDPGREGELIQRLILDDSNFKGQVLRFWISEALTNNTIEKGLKNLISSDNFNDLYKSSLARQHADWILGINLTQAASLKGGQLLSVGRVQTPILKLIVDRDFEINNFIKTYFYTVSIEINQNNNIAIFTDAVKYETKEEATFIYNKIISGTNNDIINITIEDKKEYPPNPHSLTSLQQEANKVFGYSAEKTLTIAQSLYETKKATSYPRTDSNYLGENTKDDVMKIAKDMELEIQINAESIGSRVFNNSKLTDHHAIIPLRKINANELSEDENNIFNLITRRFKGIFLREHITKNIEIELSASEIKLFAKSNKPVQIGYKKLYQANKEKEEKNKQEFSQLEKLTKGFVNINKGEIIETERKAAKNYNDSSLLSKMKTYNLGTPATRAESIEKLIKRNYVVREKKHIKSTEKGQELIDKLKERTFTEVTLTGKWENQLTLIEEGKLDYEDFIKEIKDYTLSEINNFSNINFDIKDNLPPKMIALAKKLIKEKKLENKIEDFKSFDDLKTFISNTLNKSIGTCKCGGEITSSLKAYSCNNDNCKRIVWKESFGTKINEKEAIKLLEGYSVEFKKLKSKAGKEYSATLGIDNDNKLTFITK